MIRPILAALLLVAVQADKDLVGHWTFDDEKSPAADAAGKHDGKLLKKPVRIEGRVGGAMKFDGAGSHVEIPNAPALENLQEGSFTVSAWFKPEDEPPGSEAENDAYYGIVIKSGNHAGLHYDNQGNFAMAYWVKGEEGEVQVAAASEKSYEPRKWYHLVGVVDRAAGKTLLYVNGERDGSAEWDPKLPAYEHDQGPWRIGIAEPNAEEWSWPAKGAIDDVRLYKRALSEKEIKALFEAAPKEK